MGTSLARPVIAKRQIEIARQKAPTRWPMARPVKATIKCDLS